MCTLDCNQLMVMLFNVHCSCGHCVGGTTDREADYGKNQCGECDIESNEACTDCNGVVNGGFVVDNCGLCRDPDSAEFNTG